MDKPNTENTPKLDPETEKFLDLLAGWIAESIFEKAERMAAENQGTGTGSLQS